MNIERYFNRLKDDFFFFTKELWRCKGYDKVAPLEDVDRDMCQWLQHGPKRSVTLGFRGQGKTYKVCAYVGWRLMRDPKLWVLMVSASESSAKSSLHLMRNWMSGKDPVPFLAHLSPRKSQGERSGALEFDVSGADGRNASVTACGITGQLPSRRAHLIVADDVETNENSKTIEMRAALRDRISELSSIVVTGGEIHHLMTPHAVETVALDLTKVSGFEARSWPARYPSKEEQANIINLSPMLKDKMESGQATEGHPTCPIRFHDAELNRRRAELNLGRSKWDMQFMLQVKGQLGSAYPLKLRELSAMNLDADRAPDYVVWGTRSSNLSTAIEEIPSVGLDGDCFYAPMKVSDAYSLYSRKVMYIDPSGKGPDETAWAIGGELNGNIFVLKVGAYGGSDDRFGHGDENIAKIVADAKRYRVHQIVIETNYGGEMLKQVLRPHINRAAIKPGDKRMPEGWNCMIEDVHNVDRKERRIIATLEILFNQHRIIFDHDVAMDLKLQEQIVNLRDLSGCLDQDDRIDALAGMVQRFRDYMDKDDRFTEEDKRDRAFDEALEWVERQARSEDLSEHMITWFPSRGTVQVINL